MRLAILAACTDTFYALIDELRFEPRCVDELPKRGATLAHAPASRGYEDSIGQMQAVHIRHATILALVLMATSPRHTTRAVAAHFGEGCCAERPEWPFFICWEYQRYLDAVRMWVFLKHSTKG